MGPESTWYSWKPFEHEGVRVDLEAGREPLNVVFGGENRLPKGMEPAARALVTELLQLSYNYLISKIGNDVVFSRNLTIEFSLRQVHGRQGTLMKVSVINIKDMLEQPENSQLRGYQESGFVHEILHEYTDDEDLPMLAEILYLIEKGATWRLENIQSIIREGRMPKPYIDGLNKIAYWLGYESTDDLLAKVSGHSTEEIASVLKANLVRVAKEGVE